MLDFLSARPVLEKKKEDIMRDKKDQRKNTQKEELEQKGNKYQKAMKMERNELCEIEPMRDDRGACDEKPARKRIRLVSKYPDIVQRTIAEVLAESNELDTTLWHLRHLISDGTTKVKVRLLSCENRLSFVS
jgi:hypothetical protein